MDADLYMGIVASFAAEGAPTTKVAWEIAREVVSTPQDLEADAVAARDLSIERYGA